LWEDLSAQIHGFLEGISLADLVARREIKLIAKNQDRKQLMVGENMNSMHVSVSSL
jgi:Rrf2 family iron-sulfur cluster assembly transcriptional regulator